MIGAAMRVSGKGNREDRNDEFDDAKREEQDVVEEISPDGGIGHDDAAAFPG